MLTRPSFGEYSCNVCSNSYEGSYFNHIAKEHLHEDTEAVIANLSSLDALFEVGYKLAKSRIFLLLCTLYYIPTCNMNFDTRCFFL